MKLRILLVAAMWISTHTVGVPTKVAIGAVAVVLASQLVSMARPRMRRLRSLPRPGEVELPSGPRRVLLVDTGLAGPR